jgi:hypothetical protein
MTCPMTHWLFIFLLCSCFVNIPESIANDPLYPIGYPRCDNSNQVGPWAFLEHTEKDGTKNTYLLIMTRPGTDFANILCWIDGNHHIRYQGPPPKEYPL